MLAWLKQLRRLIGGPAVSLPAVGLAAAPPATHRVDVPVAVMPGFGLRLPLVGAQGQVAGFECVWPQALAQRLAARGDDGDGVAGAAHQALLMAATQPVLDSGRAALMQLPAAVLARPAVADQSRAGMWLLVPDLATLPIALAAALRARGVRLGVPDGPPDAAPAADFVGLQGSAGGLDTLLLSAQRWHEARPRLPLVATRLAGVDDVEKLLRSGFTLAGGELSRSAAPPGQTLNAAAHRICELLNHLALNRDTALLAEAVRGDVALAYRLLRYANSPAMGLSRGVDSVEQAVMLLGRKELQRWLCVLLMSAADGRPAARALQEQALARGRFLELLARAHSEPEPEALFSMGLFSMLEVLLRVPLQEAVAPLRLGGAATQALLQAQGPWAPHLALAAALDGAGSVDSADAPTLALRWGGLPAVQALADEAWAWASAVSAADGAA